MNADPSIRNDLPRERDVRRRFDRAVHSYDEHDFLARLTAEGLLDRLQPVQVKAARVLNLGAATGHLGRQLGKHFKGSRVVNLDLSHAMLRAAKRNRGRFARGSEIQANVQSLPLVDNSVDVVIANLVLPWVADPPAMFAEVARVLRHEGVFAFAALGPDSLHELRSAFAGDDVAHLREFADMHDVGDALVRAGLRDPVMDVDRLQVRYRDSAALFRDLDAFGARNSLLGRRASLTGKERFAATRETLDNVDVCGDPEKPLRVTLELVYGHAWGGQARPGDDEFRFDVANLRGRRR